MSKKFAHMTEDDRYKIKNGLDHGHSFKEISRITGKDCTTISKEVKNRRVYRKKGCFGQSFNDCINRIGCSVSNLCENGRCKRKACRTCGKIKCYDICCDYKREFCDMLGKAPYVCNGCIKKERCTLEKALYEPVAAQKEYRQILSESREGFSICENEAKRLDGIISPLLLKGHSLHHICVNNKSRIMCSERTLYKYVGASMFKARNIDMPRTVRFRMRKKKSGFKVDKSCHKSRTYADFRAYCASNPGVGIVEMDTVHGEPGGKGILTLHFVDLHFMWMILIDDLSAQSVTDAFFTIRGRFGTELFLKLFPVILTDRGSEFSDPQKIEAGEDGELLSRVFYCDPLQSQQKGSAENNHSLLRRIIPKGTSLENYTQGDITLSMNHVNSYGRPSLNERSPYELFAAIFGEDVLKKIGAEFVPPDKIILRPSLIGK